MPNHLIHILTPALALALASCVTTPGQAVSSEKNPTGGSGSPSGLISKTLMTSDIAGVVGKELIVSHVTLPPHTSLPKHWHPGEEFGYVLEGSAKLWQKGRPTMTLSEGEVVKVPFEQIHTAITGDEGATIVVFRVHEKGLPERVMAE